MRDALVRRLPAARVTAAVAAGLLMSAGFAALAGGGRRSRAGPPGWVLRRPSTTLRAASATACSSAWRSRRCCRGSAVSSGAAMAGAVRDGAHCSRPFGWLAVVVAGCQLAHLVSRCCGWPRWLKSSVPFRRIPWGIAGFSQTNGPLLPVAQWGGAPLLSLTVALLAFALTALVQESVRWWRLGPDRHTHLAGGGPRRRHRGAGAALAHPQVHRSVRAPAQRHHGDRRRRARATCPGWGWTSTPSGAPYWTTMSTRRCAWPMRCVRAAPSSRSSSSGRRTPRTSVGQRRRQNIGPPRAIGTRSWSGRRRSPPTRLRSSRGAMNSIIVWDPQTGPGSGTTSRSCNRSGVPAVARVLPQAVPVADRAGYFVPGTGTVVHAAGVPIGVTTCWEVIFDRARPALRSPGGIVLAVPTNRHLRATRP